MAAGWAVLILVGYAIVLVGPGPIWVGRWRFLHRVPRAAVVLWQTGSVAAVLSLVAAGVLAVRQVPDLLAPQGIVAWSQLIAYVVVALFALNVAARLLFCLGRVAARTRARRARHRHLVDLLADPRHDEPTLRVLADEIPLAYCLPGLRAARVVVSAGTLAALRPVEVAAVLAHERAHLRARHDLVLETFTALHEAFPHLVRSSIPLAEGRLLVELLADDAALRSTGPAPLARALVAVAGSPVPTPALGAGSDVVLRVDRITRPAPQTTLLSVAVSALALGIVALPAVIVFAHTLL